MGVYPIALQPSEPRKPVPMGWVEKKIARSEAAIAFLRGRGFAVSRVLSYRMRGGEPMPTGNYHCPVTRASCRAPISSRWRSSMVSRPTMAGKLSFLQEQALVSLYRGHPFGHDSRAMHGLEVRGYVAPGYWNATFPELLLLTPEGRAVAADLDAEQREVAGMRRMRGTRLAAMDGGLL